MELSDLLGHCCALGCLDLITWIFSAWCPQPLNHFQSQGFIEKALENPKSLWFSRSVGGFLVPVAEFILGLHFFSNTLSLINYLNQEFSSWGPKVDSSDFKGLWKLQAKFCVYVQLWCFWEEEAWLESDSQRALWLPSCHSVHTRCSLDQGFPNQRARIGGAWGSDPLSPQVAEQGPGMAGTSKLVISY